MPSATRPQRPARWLAEAWLTGSIGSRCTLVALDQREIRAVPGSTTYRTPGTVSEVSATLVARMTRRVVCRANTRCCSADDSRAYSGSSSTARGWWASVTRGPRWLRRASSASRISRSPERNTRMSPGPSAHSSSTASQMAVITSRSSAGALAPCPCGGRPCLPRPRPEVERSGTTRPRVVPERSTSGRGRGRQGRPPQGHGASAPAEDRDVMTAICEAVDELCAEGPGDILVFLSGEREFRDAEDALRSHLGPHVTDAHHPRAVELLPLYARLSSAEQHRVFARHTTRRVVLATNVAETSLTVPSVRYVIDPGTARISRWSKATKVQRLPIEPVSQASANQRAGRCGRVADGIAIRLYSRADYESRPEFTEPEILRTSLASVILQMVAVGVAATPDDVARFPFVDPPDVRAVRDGVQLLTDLRALEAQPGGVTRLTDVGRALALLPMDPRLARMVVEAGRRNVAREVMIIAAALSIQEPRERPAEQRAQADQAHARFADPTSDFLGYLNLWHYLRDRQRELSGSAFRRMCRAEYLNYLRLREWQDVVTQLKEMARPLGITVRPPGQRATVAAGPATGTVRRAAPGARALSAVEAAAEAAPDNAAEAAPDNDAAQRPPDLRLAWDADRIHQSVLAGLLSHLGMQEATA